ncbi:MAG: globin domain-containing protein [Pseudomonadota bacterium]
MISARQAALVRQDWARTAPIKAQTARAFYANLFQAAPETKPLFRGDMELQGQKLVNTLGFVLDHLDDPEALLPAARALAIRHVGYGVTADHYDRVGEALLQTLEDLLGADFADEARRAWVAVYDHVAGEMKRAAYA